VGTFKVGSRTICKTDPQYAELPEVGDEIVIFQPKDDRGDERFLDAYDGAGVVTIKSDGRLALPQAFRVDTALRSLGSGQDLFARLHELAQERPR
jgi:hypothetical protein